MLKPSKQQVAVREIQRLLDRGFGQREAARQLGVSRGQLFNILHGRTGVGKQSATAILANAGQKQSMLVFRDYGQVWVQPATWANRSLIGEYWEAVKRAREKGDWSRVEELRGRSVTIIDKGKRVRLKLVTDPDMLRQLDDAGQLDPLEVAKYGLRRARRGKK